MAVVALIEMTSIDPMDAVRALNGSTAWLMKIGELATKLGTPNGWMGDRWQKVLWFFSRCWQGINCIQELFVFAKDPRTAIIAAVQQFTSWIATGLREPSVREHETEVPELDFFFTENPLLAGKSIVSYKYSLGPIQWWMGFVKNANCGKNRHEKWEISNKHGVNLRTWE